jgi:hypothetical protein
VFLQQNSEKLLRGNQTAEAPLAVNYGETGLVALHCLPRRVFLIGIRSDDRWRRIHDFAQGHRVGGSD